MSHILQEFHAQVFQESVHEFNVKKVMEGLSGSPTCLDQQRAKLLVYLCDHPVVAAAVLDEFSSHEAFFQDLLKQLDTK